MSLTSFFAFIAVGFGQAPARPFFVGAYTSTEGSKGIYSATLDMQTGVISLPTLAATMPNPSYLASSPSGACLYAVEESRHGSVRAFKIVGETGLRALNSEPVGGSSPCYVSVDPKGTSVLTASYVGGIVSRFPIEENGNLDPANFTSESSGNGKSVSHMHWFQATPIGQDIYGCDLGGDEVRHYRMTSGHLAVDFAKTPPGAGPRHGAWGRNGRFLYVNCEMGNCVCVFSVSSDDGNLKRIQTIGVLPRNVAPHGNTTAEIACDPGGKRLYVSNRGHDSIAVFRIASNGTLSPIQDKPLGLHIPRGFAIDPSGRWLVAAGQESNDLEALPINRATGMLGEPGPKVSLAKPVCIVFPNG